MTREWLAQRLKMGNAARTTGKRSRAINAKPNASRNWEGDPNTLKEAGQSR